MNVDKEDFSDVLFPLLLDAVDAEEYVVDKENGRVAFWGGGDTITVITKYGEKSVTSIHTSNLYRDPTRHEAVVKMDDHLSTLNKEPEKYNPFENKGENNEN